MCVLVFLLSSSIVPHLDPFGGSFLLNHARAADQNTTSPTTTERSADRAISSASSSCNNQIAHCNKLWVSSFGPLHNVLVEISLARGLRAALTARRAELLYLHTKILPWYWAKP